MSYQTSLIISKVDHVNEQQILTENKLIELNGRINKVEENKDHIGTHNVTPTPNIYVTCGGNNNFDTDVHLPKFHGRTNNPRNYLDKLKRYYEKNRRNRKIENETEYLQDLLENSFENGAAKWLTLIKQDITTWEQFETAFTRKYWNRDVQRGIRHKIENEKYRPGGKLSRADYLIERVLLLRSITPPMSDEEIIVVLSEHFPDITQDAIRVQNITTIPDLELLLQREDLLHHSHGNQQGQTYRKQSQNSDQQRSPRPDQGYQENRYPQRQNNQHNGNNNNYRNNQYYRYDNRQNHGQNRTNPYPQNRNYQQRNDYTNRPDDRKFNNQHPTKEQSKVCATIVRTEDHHPQSPKRQDQHLN